MVPQRQEPVVRMMLGTPPASRASSWLKASVFRDGSYGPPRHRGARFMWSVRGPPVGRPLTISQGSGGQVRAPCPIAVLGTDDLEPRVAIALSGDPEFSGHLTGREMEELGRASEVEEHLHLPRQAPLGEPYSLASRRVPS